MLLSRFAIKELFVLGHLHSCPSAWRHRRKQIAFAMNILKMAKGLP